MKQQSLKKFSLLYLFLSVAILLHAQAPSGYYSSAKGEKGASLKTALYKKIASHTELSYKQVWTAYKTTDLRADGKIWDMYSNTTNFTYGTDQAGNYTKEGDVYNREHSFPKSWFNDAAPMYTDLFHLYPTDGYVNSRRSNYPFGETNGEKYQSNGGFSKLGACTVSGYTGIVFEPADEYKGDFARSYFYMATAYEDKIAGWKSDMLSGNSYTAYKDWALQMLLRWAAEDPVSQKEIDRNNAVYKLQGNRNPYIDYPGLEQYVWGAKTDVAFDPDNYDSGTVDPVDPDKGDSTQSAVAAPTFSLVAGAVAAGTEVTISTSTTGAYVYYTVNDGDLQTSYSSATVAINETSTIKAYAMLGETSSDTVTVTYTVASDEPVGDNVYTLITADDQLLSGAQYLIVSEDGAYAMGANSENSSYRTNTSVTATEGVITTSVGGTGEPVAFVLGGDANEWTLFDSFSSTYLSLDSDGNKLNSTDAATSNKAQWSISILSSGIATITNNNLTARSIKYNPSSPRFACYKNTSSNMSEVSMYKKATVSAIASAISVQDGTYTVHSLDGKTIRRAASLESAINGLSAGVYVVNGKKILVK